MIEKQTFERIHAFSYRVSLVRETGDPLRSFKVRLPLDAAVAARYFLPDNLDRETFGILILNTRNTVIGHNTVAIGSLNASLVHPREVYKAAILANGAAIVCYHNHPSGDPVPSSEDMSLTKILAKAGSILGIELLDHIILGQDPNERGARTELSGITYTSFKERGEF